MYYPANVPGLIVRTTYLTRNPSDLPASHLLSCSHKKRLFLFSFGDVGTGKRLQTTAMYQLLQSISYGHCRQLSPSSGRHLSHFIRTPNLQRPVACEKNMMDPECPSTLIPRVSSVPLFLDIGSGQSRLTAVPASVMLAQQ